MQGDCLPKARFAVVAKSASRNDMQLAVDELQKFLYG